MDFINPEINTVYLSLKNSSALIKNLSDNNALETPSSYYERYGKLNVSTSIIENNNENKIFNLAELLYNNSDYIKKTSVIVLTKTKFLKDEINKIFDLKLDAKEEFYSYIFYIYKYCYVNNFFQNNIEKFIPNYDFEMLEENEAAKAFVETLMNQFDKLNNVLASTTDFYSYENIEYEYINYLTQLLGLEQKQLLIEEETKFRELAKNIIDIYTVKGTEYSFELFFSFLGLNVEMINYFFDRRFYGTNYNSETDSNKKNEYRFYLTKNDPRDNKFNELGFGSSEIVTDKDFSKQQNVFDFDDIVEQYSAGDNESGRTGNGLLCVLGYEDQYYDIIEHKFKPYNGPVFKYFRTNFVEFKPRLKYTPLKNLSDSTKTTFSKVVKFLTPLFIRYNIVVVLADNELDNDILTFENNEYPKDRLYILDGELWDINGKFSINNAEGSKYIDNWDDYSNGYSTIPYTNENKKNVYTNSVCCGITSCYNCDTGETEYYNSFKTPISSNTIRTINTTKYYGSHMYPTISQYTMSKPLVDFGNKEGYCLYNDVDAANKYYYSNNAKHRKCMGDYGKAIGNSIDSDFNGYYIGPEKHPTLRNVIEDLGNYEVIETRENVTFEESEGLDFLNNYFEEVEITTETETKTYNALKVNERISVGILIKVFKENDLSTLYEKEKTLDKLLITEDAIFKKSKWFKDATLFINDFVWIDNEMYKVLEVLKTSKNERYVRVAKTEYFGKLVEKGGELRLYEYDEDYEGFSEKDDADNFILYNNYHVIKNESRDRPIELNNDKRIYNEDEMLKSLYNSSFGLFNDFDIGDIAHE